MKTKYLVPALVVAMANLSACGGGGGSNTPKTPDPIVKTCDNGGKDYPTCTPPYIGANLQTTVSTPPFAVGSEEMKSFNYLNDFRRNLGLGLLAYSQELTLSAVNHANYLKINRVGGFSEDSGKPGYTGATPTERANYAGYKTNEFVSGGLAVGNTASGAIQSLINSVYHRGVLIGQSWTDVGSATYCINCDGTIALNINVAKKDHYGQKNASDFVMFYPFNNQAGVSLTMAGETVNPFPEYPDGLVYGKVGYPISFAVEAGHVLELKQFTLTENGSSVSLNSYVYTASNDPNKLILKNEAWLIAKSQLKPLTKYNVVLQANINGLSISCENGRIVYGKTSGCSWSFTTSDGSSEFYNQYQ